MKKTEPREAPGPAAPPDEPFDKLLSRIEGIVQQLESGRLPLEEAVTAFREGMTLVHAASRKLDGVERQVEYLLKNPQGAAAPTSPPAPAPGPAGGAPVDDDIPF